MQEGDHGNFPFRLFFLFKMRQLWEMDGCKNSRGWANNKIKPSRRPYYIIFCKSYNPNMKEILFLL